MSNLINTSIITDRIGRQEVLLSINPAQLWQNLINQTGDTFSWNWATDNSAKCTTIAQVLSTDIGMTCQLSYDTVQLQAWLVHCPLGAQIELVITEHVREFCDCFDLLWNCLQHLKKTAIVCVTQGSFFLIYLSFASVQKTRAKNWLPHCCSNEIFCQFQLCSSTFCQ